MTAPRMRAKGVYRTETIKDEGGERGFDKGGTRRTRGAGRRRRKDDESLVKSPVNGDGFGLCYM